MTITEGAYRDTGSQINYWTPITDIYNDISSIHKYSHLLVPCFGDTNTHSYYPAFIENGHFIGLPTSHQTTILHMIPKLGFLHHHHDPFRDAFINLFLKCVVLAVERDEITQSKVWWPLAKISHSISFQKETAVIISSFCWKTGKLYIFQVKQLRLATNVFSEPRTEQVSADQVTARKIVWTSRLTDKGNN